VVDSTRVPKISQAIGRSRSDLVGLTQKGAAVAELAASLHELVTKVVHHLALKNYRCPPTSEGLNFAAELDKLEFFAQQLQPGRVIVGELQIRAVDRLNKKLEMSGADWGLDLEGPHEEPWVVFEDVTIRNQPPSGNGERLAIKEMK
jgi:hypothetical protein